MKQVSILNKCLIDLTLHIDQSRIETDKLKTDIECIVHSLKVLMSLQTICMLAFCILACRRVIF